MTTAKARQHVAATRRLCRGSEASCALEQPCASEPVPSCAMVRSGQVRHAGGKPFTVDLVGQAERLRGLPPPHTVLLCAKCKGVAYCSKDCPRSLSLSAGRCYSGE